MGNWEDYFMSVAVQRGYRLRQCYFDPALCLWTILIDDGTEHGLEIEEPVPHKVTAAIKALPIRD